MLSLCLVRWLCIVLAICVPMAYAVVSSPTITMGTAPSLSACGTDPSIVGNDHAGKVTIGAGVITSCTLTFAIPYVIAPACFVNNEGQVLLTRAVSTTTTLTITALATFATNPIAYVCFGMS